MKLWTIRTQECEATMDGHEDRVWALAVAPVGGGRQAVTGGGDSVLNVWEDVTKEEEEVALARAEAMVEKEQALQNSVYRKDHFQVCFGINLQRLFVEACQHSLSYLLLPPSFSPPPPPPSSSSHSFLSRAHSLPPSFSLSPSLT